MSGAGEARELAQQLRLYDETEHGKRAQLHRQIMAVLFANTTQIAIALERALVPSAGTPEGLRKDDLVREVLTFEFPDQQASPALRTLFASALVDHLLALLAASPSSPSSPSRREPGREITAEDIARAFCLVGECPLHGASVEKAECAFGCNVGRKQGLYRGADAVLALLHPPSPDAAVTAGQGP
jgi:hypothetical protein